MESTLWFAVGFVVSMFVNPLIHSAIKKHELNKDRNNERKKATKNEYDRIC